MTILRSILLTLFLILVFSISQIWFILLFTKTEILPVTAQAHYGVTIPISFLIAYLVTFKFFWKSKKGLQSRLKITAGDWKAMPLLLFIAVGLQLSFQPLWDLQDIWNFIMNSGKVTKHSEFVGLDFSSLYRLVSVLLVSPICEELFFRQFLLKKLLERNSKIIAIFISSCCFTIIHLESPISLLPAFISGIIFSLIFVKTDKIACAVLLHFLFNLCYQFLTVYGGAYDVWLQSLNFSYLYWALSLMGFVITYFGCKRLLKTV